MDRPSELPQDEPNYLEKMPLREVWRWWLGTFLGIAGLGLAHFNIPDGQGAFALISAFGASAVLVFGNRRHFFAQPRSLVGGHVLSALVGVLSFKIFHGHPWLAASIGTATAIAVMHVTGTLHPPGGATALFAIIGPDKIHDLGFFYVIAPVGSGALFLLLIALAFNNIASDKRYPESWF
jgi:CBS-domain-containing membrane protein